MLDSEGCPDSTVKANPILLECLINNLVVNAIRHTDSGTILVAVSGTGCLEVSNPAADGPLDTSEIFNRFRSGDSKTTGTGLGLAIVKAICDFHGWQILYSYIDNHHSFKVAMK